MTHLKMSSNGPMTTAQFPSRTDPRRRRRPAADIATPCSTLIQPFRAESFEAFLRSGDLVLGVDPAPGRPSTPEMTL